MTQARRWWVKLWWLFLRTGCAERKLANQKFTLIAIHELEQNDSWHFLGRVGNVLGTEVVIASCFGGEMECCFLSLRAQPDKSLPARTQMMYSGIDRNGEIRIAVGRAHPRAIDPETSRWSGPRQKCRVVLKEIHMCLCGVQLNRRTLFIVCLHVKFDFGRAASRNRRGARRLCLSVGSWHDREEDHSDK